MIDWRWTEVDALESKERWNEAKSLLIKNWQQNPNDLKVIIRLGFFCWYVLVERGPLGIKNVDLDELENVLNEVTHFGLANFMTNEDFLWCFGYMISLFPYYFGDYEHWEQKGISMLKRAYELCPDEPVYRYSYLASFTYTEGKLKDEFYQVQSVLEDRFKGEGVLSDYFKDVWHS
ncbi:hypothetical protein [Sporolactobacillus laevolacticus]|uniref:Uncharacterized protein n=1 Tax=Sporolactobacillus laevolacticus DSM 442 TaxID=1395513 RepID=V6ITR7_9BACL|nr:hypothetical protein [Sporolactobacillus laevolacticus]EST10253.1 hypothetical protein P343_18120 [Sporolactobacillus laevolacticus DSM 442]